MGHETIDDLRLARHLELGQEVPVSEKHHAKYELHEDQRRRASPPPRDIPKSLVKVHVLEIEVFDVGLEQLNAFLIAGCRINKQRKVRCATWRLESGSSEEREWKK
jgi:hypothetical protein